MSTRRRTLMCGAVVAFVVFAVVVEQVMTNGPLIDLDHHLADVYGNGRLGRAPSVEELLGNGRLVTVAHAFAPLGDARFLLLVVGVLAAFVFRQGHTREAVFLVTAAVGGIALDLAARLVIGWVRPDLPFPYSVLGRYGLPSGHALDSASCYGAMVVTMWMHLTRSARIVVTAGVTVLVACISYSRVVLIVHYLTDVLAGAALGVAWLLLLAVAFSLPRDDNRLSPAA